MITNKSTKPVKTKSTGSKQVLDKKVPDDKSRKREDAKHSVIKRDITESADKSMDNLVINKKSTPNQKPGPLSKELKYPTERQAVYDKLWAILGITNEKMEFDMTALEKDKVRQQQIIDLQNDVRKYFNATAWPFFSKPDLKDKYISLIRSLLKQQNYTIQYFRAYDAKTNVVVQKNIKVIKIEKK